LIKMVQSSMVSFLMLY